MGYAGGYVSHTASFEVQRPVGEVFPLFTPEGEKLWVPGWDYENIMGTADLGEDYVFTTGAHDHPSGKAIWLVKRFDEASHLVELYRVEPVAKVGVVTVSCASPSEGSTRVEVTYKYAALSERGDEFLRGFTREYFEGFIGEWERLLNEYFAATTP